MANNIIVGNNILTATADSPMSIFTTANTSIIRGLSNGNYISFDPSRQINSLTLIEKGKGYLLNSKVARDLSNVFGTSDGAVLLSSIITQIP